MRQHGLMSCQQILKRWRGAAVYRVVEGWRQATRAAALQDCHARNLVPAEP